MSDAKKAFTDYQHGRRNTLVYRLRLSSLYHQKRARFFEGCDRFATAFSVVGSAAAILQFIKPIAPNSELWASAAVTLVSTTALVWAFSQKARQHSELARDFRKLLGDVESAGEYLEAEQIDRFNGSFHQLASQEPAPMSALVAECQNQLAMASQGKPVVVLPLHQRLLKNFIDFEPVKPDPEPAAGS